MYAEILLMLLLVVVIISLPLAPHRGSSESENSDLFGAEPMPLRELTCTVYPRPDVTLRTFA